MIDSRQEVESHLYRRIQGKKHTWYVPATEYAAEGVHMARGEGYGGDVIKFRLLDGSVDEVKGPWRMRNADPLFEDTGVDVRHTYWTRITINHRGSAFYNEDSLCAGGYDRYLEVLRQFWEAHSDLRHAYCSVDSRVSIRGGLVDRQDSRVWLIKTHVKYIREEWAA